MLPFCKFIKFNKFPNRAVNNVAKRSVIIVPHKLSQKGLFVSPNKLIQKQLFAFPIKLSQRFFMLPMIKDSPKKLLHVPLIKQHTRKEGGLALIIIGYC